MAEQDLIDRVALGSSQTDASETFLGRADWLAAGLQVLIEEGIDAVRITRLAENLSVTRGSFYWHFADRDDLCACLIEVWKQKNTAAVLRAVGDAKTLSEGILKVFDAWIDPASFDPLLDQALRDWARRSPLVLAAVEAADRERIEAICDLFRRFGYAATEAFIRARVLYFAQVGYYALEIKEPMSDRLGYLEAYYESFTGRTMEPEVAAAHRRKYGVDTEETL